VDATIWLVPRCDLLPAELCSDVAVGTSCFPFCMAARVSGSRNANPVFANADTWRQGKQVLMRDCAKQEQAPAAAYNSFFLREGGGGTTLALAAQMHNHGTIIATDSDKRRLAPIFERLKRAGVTIANVRAPKGKDDEPLKGLEQQADLVLVDAPCSGTGTWRRHPDAKWRMRPVSLDDRIKDQALVLDRAARYVKPGGRMVYATCSLLAEENEDRVAAFLARTPGFSVRSVPFPQFATSDGYLRLTPLSAGTDGFFAALLVKAE
jgi:precorrin-6B methylase 2